MRIKIQDNPTLYPETAVRGRLRLSGLSREKTEKVLAQVLDHLPEDEYVAEETVSQMIRNRLKGESRKCYDTVTKYYNLRRTKAEVPPLVVALEGASATGKSILSLELASILVTTRIIGTDTIRQLKRQQTDERHHPELFCHTYQAHQYSQAGPHALDRIIRGYLAQCKIMKPAITGLVTRIIKEGASGLIEGVHIIPGQMTRISDMIIEMVINPDIQAHQQMFISKGVTEKLTTVEARDSQREEEFQATRKIQEYMLEKARENKVSVFELNDFEETTQSLIAFLYERIEEIVNKNATEKSRN